MAKRTEVIDETAEFTEMDYDKAKDMFITKDQAKTAAEKLLARKRGETGYPIIAQVDTRL